MCEGKHFRIREAWGKLCYVIYAMSVVAEGVNDFCVNAFVGNKIHDAMG